MAIVVDEPIINSPFVEPTRHYRMRGGQAELVDARRPSGFTPGLRTRGGQGTLLEEEHVELPLVNAIRERIRAWREAGYPGASRTTLDLLRHWRAPGRDLDARVVAVGGAALDEVALGAYRREIESRLISAIRPAADEGEQPLLPVLHDMAGIGTTDVTPFLTVKACQPTVRSHLSQAVCDSGWEATVARALDESVRVRAWVKNHRLGFEIPYSFRGEAHAYTPDFLVELAGPERGAADGRERGEHLVIEVKGLEREQDRAKQVGMQRWIDAVNHWGRLGSWRFEKLHSPHDLARVL